MSPFNENLKNFSKKYWRNFDYAFDTKKNKGVFKKSEVLGNGIPIPTIKILLKIKQHSKIKKRVKNIIFNYDYKTGNGTGQLLQNIYTNLKNEK